MPFEQSPGISRKLWSLETALRKSAPEEERRLCSSEFFKLMRMVNSWDLAGTP